jgi:hypothetical protein
MFDKLVKNIKKQNDTLLEEQLFLEELDNMDRIIDDDEDIIEGEEGDVDNISLDDIPTDDSVESDSIDEIDDEDKVYYVEDNLEKMVNGELLFDGEDPNAASGIGPAFDTIEGALGSSNDIDLDEKLANESYEQLFGEETDIDKDTLEDNNEILNNEGTDMNSFDESFNAIMNNSDTDNDYLFSEETNNTDTEDNTSSNDTSLDEAYRLIMEGGKSKSDDNDDDDDDDKDDDKDDDDDSSCDDDTSCDDDDKDDDDDTSSDDDDDDSDDDDDKDDDKDDDDDDKKDSKKSTLDECYAAIMECGSSCVPADHSIFFDSDMPSNSATVKGEYDGDKSSVFFGSDMMPKDSATVEFNEAYESIMNEEGWQLKQTSKATTNASEFDKLYDGIMNNRDKAPKEDYALEDLTNNYW